MMRLFLTLAATCVFLAKINAQTACPVGESDSAVGSFCNQGNDRAGNEKCAAHCTKTYGKELIRAQCSNTRPGNSLRECICDLKCANGGCWGDPHCHSFDNAQFGFQALRKYYVFKPLKPFPTFPEFEIHQSNRPWGNGPMAVLANCWFIVPDWGQIIHVVSPSAANQIFQVYANGKHVNLPHRFSRYVKHREDFINAIFADNVKRNLQITTSFGLRLVLSAHPTGGAGAVAIYSDISVDIPRHPELRGNTGGILGRWDDNPANDNIDSHGKPQPLDINFSAAFGNSWLVPGGGTPNACELDLAKRKHDEHVKKFDEANRKKLVKLCTDNLERANVKDCLKHLDRPSVIIGNCVVDLEHVPDEPSQQQFLKAMMAKLDHACPHIDIKPADNRKCECKN